MIEIEESAEPRTTTHTTGHLTHGRAGDEAIADNMVIPFGVVTLDAPPSLRWSLRETRPPSAKLTAQERFSSIRYAIASRSRWSHQSRCESNNDSQRGGVDHEGQLIAPLPRG